MSRISTVMTLNSLNLSLRLVNSGYGLKLANGILEIKIRSVVLRVRVLISVHMVSCVYLIFYVIFIRKRYMKVMKRNLVTFLTE